MGFLRTSRTTATPKILPEQQGALDMMMSYAKQGQTPYTGDFNVSPDMLAFFNKALTEDTFGVGTALQTFMNSGQPVDQTAEFQKERQVAETAATKASSDVIAKAQAAGAGYSSVAAGEAARAGAEVKSQAELDILGKITTAKENAANRQVQAIGLASQFVTAMRQQMIYASQVELAANEFSKGMTYQEFQRMHPDVYQILQSIWGRNVDYVVQNQPTALGNFLQFAGGVAKIAGAAAGAGFSLDPTTWGRVV